jgi:PAS domain S-box-containing protein
VNDRSVWRRIFHPGNGQAKDTLELEATPDPGRSHERFRLAFEQVPIAMAIVGPNLRFIQVNSALCDLFGYTFAELESLTVADLTHPDDVARTLELMERLVAREISSFEVQRRYRTRAGKTVWGEVKFTRLEEESGATSDYLAVFEDITERRRTEDALRNSEDRHRDLVEHSGLLIGTHDMDGNILSVNHSLVRLVECEAAEELIGANLGDFLAPNVRHLFPAYLNTMREKGHAHGLMKVVTRGGVEKILEYDNSVRQEGLTSPIVRCFGHDVTEQRAAARALRASEARYRALYEDNPAMYFTVDPAGVILSVNRFGAEQLGYSPSDLVGRSVLDVFHEADRDAVIEQVAACLRDPASVGSWEFRKRHRNGRTLWVREIARAVTNAAGGTELLIVCEDITARRRTEEALRDSEARLRALGDNLPNGAVYQMVRAPDGHIGFAYMSAGIKQLAGVSAEEAMRDAQAVFDLIPQEDRPRINAALEESMRTLSIFDAEVRIRARPDQIKWIHVRAAPRRLPDGGTLWDGVQVDVTDARRDLEALLQTVGAIVWEGEGDVAAEAVADTFVSQQAERLLGYPLSDWLEQPTFWLDHLHPDDRPRVLSQRREAIAARRDYELDYRMIAKDGRTLWLRDIVNVVAKDEHRLKLRGIMVDVTESKRAEAALRESEERFRTLAETMPAAILIFRGERFVYVNPAAELVTGYSREELLAMKFWELVHPDSRVAARERAEMRQRGERVPSRNELCMVTRAGAEIWIETISTNIVFQGQPSVLVTGFDITQRARTEAALRQSEEALRQSHERVRDLAGKLMLTQEEERKRISRELHDDVNQKIAALAIAISKLRKELPESADIVRDQLTDLQRRTTTLSEDVRRLSHQLHPAALEHAGLVAALQSHCAEFSSREGIEVTLTIRDTTEMIPLDMALCLYRVTQESLRNIAKHAGTHEARVTLATAEEGIHLSIADTGAGFDPGQVKRKGGLGLVSMEERVRLLRGSLQIKTQPDGGTELHVHLPFGQTTS